MKNGFEDLEVWQKSHKLTLEIYKLADKFPNKERFRLTDQLCRAVSSIPSNIVEGRGRYSYKEFVKFLYVARGSLEETKYHLILARDLGYIEETEFNRLIEECINIGKMLNGLIKSIYDKM